MKFIVVSDFHYISREQMLPGTDEELKMQPAVCETVIDQLIADQNADTVLFTGDLTNDGDLNSHRDVAALLNKLKNSGKKVYVLTATHDFHHNKSWVQKYPRTVQYKRTPWELPFFDPDREDFSRLVSDEFISYPKNEQIPALTRAAGYSELWEIYKDFLPEHPVSVLESDQSYCVSLDENTWCLMLNDCQRDEESRHNVSVTFSPVCLRWIDQTVKEAKKQGKFIFACTHHPFVPPVPAYKIGAGYRDMREPLPGHMLADIGISLIFTGHSHFCDVGFLTSDKGNVLCDITTPSVRFFPPRYRVVDLDGKNARVSIRCVPVEIPKGYTLSQSTLEAHYRERFIEEYRQKIQNMGGAAARILPGLTVKKLLPLCKKASGLTESEIGKIQDLKIFDIVMELVLNMQSGDGTYTPDTPVYKFMMGLSAVLDDMIRFLPAPDIRKKYLKGYSVSELIEPMLFNNYIPDGSAEFDFTRLPVQNVTTPEFNTHMGGILLGVLYALTLPFSFIAAPAAVLALPVLSAKTAQKRKNKPALPERY